MKPPRLVLPRLVLLAVAGTSVLALTGCAPTGDVAIKVGSVSYTHDDVDKLVGFQCAASQANGGNPDAPQTKVSRAQVRSEWASRLYDAAVYARIGANADVEPDLAKIKTDLAGLPAAVDATVPKADRARVVELITETYETASMFEAAFLKIHGQDALTTMDQQALTTAAQELKATVTGDDDIDLDPVYGLTKDGSGANANDASMSLPVSAFAKAAAAKESAAEWIAGLPKNQVCG